MKVRHVEAFGDSLLVVQQVSGECQCLEGSLNAYLDKCLDVIKSSFDEFCIHYIPRHENSRANDLAQGGHLVIMCKARIFMLKQNWCSEVRKSSSIQSLTV
jgi:hypothetical protein